jgi:hypothetical protein
MNKKLRGFWKTGGLALALASTAALLAAGTARADTLVIANQASFGGGVIQTVNATTHVFVNEFVPTGASGTNNGRGVAVLGNFVYYTELTSGFGPSDGIHVALFNNGAGSADIHAPFPNPVPGTGIVDLAEANGLLYVLTGYPNGPEVVQATDGNGNNVGGPITLHNLTGGILTNSDGFTVLANGNWLINAGDAVNSYNQFNPLTGNEIAGTTIQPHNANGLCGSSTGVDFDGTFLYFECNLNSIVQTDLLGNFIANTAQTRSGFEDISIVGAPPINPPGAPEPATLSLLGLALLGLAWNRKRSA